MSRDPASMRTPITSLLALIVALALAPAAGAPTVNVVVPGGFRVTTFASGLEHPTAMAWGPDGRLYVTQDTGNVVVTRSGSRKPVVVARGLRTPLGLAWLEDDLYVSEQGRLSRYTLQGSSLGGRRIVVRGLPFGRHQQDNVVVGPDGRLYLGSGSTCDVCREKDRRSATVLSLRPDGSDLRVVARGLRNPYGLAFQPGTGRLYASVNGQDEIGTKAHPEPAESVVVVRRGAFYGWPRCWPSYRLRKLAGRCRGVTAAGRVPRAALVRGRHRVLARRPLRRALGPVPEQPSRPAGRCGSGSDQAGRRSGSPTSREASTTRSRSSWTGPGRCSSPTGAAG